MVSRPRGPHQGHVPLVEFPELGRDDALAAARQLLVAVGLDVPRVGEDDPGRQRDVDVGRPEIGLGLVRVEVVRGNRRAGVAVAHEDRGVQLMKSLEVDRAVARRPPSMCRA